MSAGEKHLLTRAEAAEYLGISLFVLDRHRRTREIPWVALGEGGTCVRIERSKLDAFIQRRAV